MRPFADALDLNGAMICANGAHVLGPDGDEIAFHPLPSDPRQIVADYADELELQFNVYTRREVFYTRETPWLDLYRRRLRTFEPRHIANTASKIENLPITKVMVIDDPSRIPAHRAALAERLDLDAVRLTVSEPEYLEVLPAGVDKGHGLRVLANALGIRQSETAAIGDYDNDLEMIQWAGVGAAMGNATPAVRDAAQVRVGTCDEAGVAQFVDWILQNNEQYADRSIPKGR